MNKSNNEKLSAYAYASEELAKSVLADIKDNGSYISDATILCVNKFAKASEDVTALLRFLDPKLRTALN